MSDINKNNQITQDDFTFVQLDKKIHDAKFETQSSTFLKDAMKRFVKNKASVVCGILLGILAILSIFVPILNPNDIVTSASEYQFLAPRWFNKTNALGFLDGTTKYKNVTLDFSDPENPKPTGSFDPNYVVGEIKAEVYNDNTNASIYGWGGVVSLNADSVKGNVMFVAPRAYLDTDFTYDFQVSFSSHNEMNKYEPEYQVIAFVYYDYSEPTKVVLKDFSKDLGDVTISNISKTILENRPDANKQIAFNVQVGLELKTNPNGVRVEKTFPSLYISSLKVVNPNDSEDTEFNHVNFTEGNEVMCREIQGAANAYEVEGFGSATLYAGSIARGSFRYDKYGAVFGEVTTEIDTFTMDKYIKAGYCSYDYKVGMSSFKILDDDRCPVREIIEQKTVSAAGVTVTKLICKISKFREKGYTEMPKYLFGTDNSGHDYFKVVFTGLRTSFLLGVLVSAICIIFGVIWGAISGYFGGTIDLVMERFTEILGGVPTFVIVSLCVLHLGSGFGVFILSLTLTGWIGTAAKTRSQFYRYKGREYVLASRTLGADDKRLIFKHILPNSIGPLVTGAVLMIPSVIFTESSLSYLGIGFKEMESFGTSLSRAQGFIGNAPYLIISSSIIVSILMISFNLLGNGLRDAFNPSLKGVE